MIFQLSRSDHVTDVLASLHWLRVPERIQFKIAVLVHTVLHGTAPRYLGPLVRVPDLPGRRCLRSASTNRLVVPSFKLATVGRRTFKVAAAQTWNSLPEDETTSPTLYQFFVKDLKSFVSYVILTLFLNLTFFNYPHKGFEVALLLRTP